MAAGFQEGIFQHVKTLAANLKAQPWEFTQHSLLLPVLLKQVTREVLNQKEGKQTLPLDRKSSKDFKAIFNPPQGGVPSQALIKGPRQGSRSHGIGPHPVPLI